MNETKTAKKEDNGFGISAKSFIIAIAVLLALMVGTYVLTLVLPAGEFARTVDASGDSIINLDKGFSYTEGGISFGKWLLSPILVLGAEGSSTIIMVIAFLLIIGGIFNSLYSFNLMNYMLDRIVEKFGSRRYTLMAVVTFFFMFMGAFIGSFEEVIPLVPIVAALAVSLGWDKETGLGMSMVATACGFSSGVANPFTIGVAQKLAGIPMFSGMWFRIIVMICIYCLLLAFLRVHAKRIEVPLETELQRETMAKDPKLDRAIKFFGISLATGLVLILLSGVITALQDYTMVVVVLMFLVAGIGSTLMAGMGGKFLAKTFGSGLVKMLPAVLLILMASSIRYTLTEGNVLDTLLYYGMNATDGLSKGAIILIMYAIAMILNFFVSSGSAEAILLIPLLVPIAQISGISENLAVLAYAFGDGFSNILYPTNAATLICLGLIDINYGKYLKWSWKFQLANLVLTSLLLLLGLAVGY